MPPASAAAPAPQPASAPVEEPQVVDLSAQLGRPDPAPAASPSRPVDPPSSDVPLLLEMPPEFQLSVPAPDIQVHFYAREPGRRFVLIGGRRFQGGEEIAPGLILDEIVRDGLLVEWRGERFVMPARR
jgi:general secretion pathway protein B